MLASIRRSLVSHVEELYRPGRRLRKSLNVYVQSSVQKTYRYGHNSKVRVDRPVEVVLESELHSLGRCIDLVRPAGLLVSSVSKSDWVKALNALEHSMSEIRTVCDPDRPLSPNEWGKLVDEVELGAKFEKQKALLALSAKEEGEVNPSTSASSKVDEEDSGINFSIFTQE